VRVWADGERLHCDAPRGVLTASLQAELADHKPEILALLQAAVPVGGRPPQLRPRSGTGLPPLSFAQQRLWFLDRLDPGNLAYTMATSRRLPGPLDVAALRAGLDEIVRRHEILRTSFGLENGEPVQIIAAAAPGILPVVDLEMLPAAERGPAADRLGAEEAERPFDLDRGPLFRTTLLRLGAEEHRLLLTMHHVVADGWSLGVLVRELTTLYTAFAAGQASPLPEPPVQYADFAVWQREWLAGRTLDAQLAYWRHQLDGGVPTLALPMARPRSAARTFTAARHSFRLSQALLEGARRVSAEHAVTLFMTLMAAFTSVLHRYTGETAVGIGTAVANRRRVELEGLIGFFANTLVLRTDFGGDPTFRELLGRVREVALGAYEHQDLPFEKLVEDLQPERSRSLSPFFQVSFVLQNAPLDGELDVTAAASPFDLTALFREERHELVGVFMYGAERFDATTIARLAGHFETLLAAAIADPSRRVSQLPILTPAERRQLLIEWNATRTEYPRHACVHELFEAEATRAPHQVAVVLGDTSLTYGELDRRADELARYLRSAEVGRDRVVGVWMERSLELVIALLGILKAGGAYLPLDLAAPPARLGFMIQDASLTLILTHERLRQRLPVSDARVVSLDGDAAAIGRAPETAQHAAPAPESLACVMYTSGSTGAPKGVSVPHRAVVRLVKGADYAQFGPDEVFLQLAPVSFDASTLEIWGSLLNGGRLVLCPPGTPSLDEMGALIAHHRVTTLWLTAALFHQVVDQRLEILAPLRQLLAGGDVLSVPHARSVREHLPTLRLVNGYGPTENTTFTCCHAITDGDGHGPSIPIGRPIANTRVYVLDSHGQPVPIGIPGELAAAGDGLARGYVNRPELTAERFVTASLPEAPGERLYRTGDVVRYLPDGAVEFLGRADEQVKIRGYRVEPGEIEAVLRAHPAVRESVVVARADAGGDRCLVAYVIASGEGAQAAGELRAYLRTRLPEYMVPSAFVALEHFPVTPNGKVDRRALPAPGPSVPAAGAAISPRDDLETRLTRIWEETLGVRPVGPQDNFFDLGGHSLLAVRLFARIEHAFGRALPLAALFEAPTVGLLAARMRQDGRTASSRSLVAVQPRGGKPPLFAVPGVGGHVVSFSELARQLGPDQPVYGLQARGLDGDAQPFARIEDMAAHYASEVREVQPRGPYHLLGVCMGGVVTFEMAQRLHAEGETVALLVLLDTYRRIPAPRPAGGRRPRYSLAVARFVLGRLALYAQTLGQLEPRERWDYVRGKAMMLRERLARLDPLVGARGEIRRAMVLEASYLAYTRYIPRPYPGPVTLFTAGGRPLAPHDRRLGWGELALGGFEVFTVPGVDSGQTLAEPNVGALVRELRASLKRANGGLER
jgi:amino acid adenylation domain-containing protein